jgi:hypothetical protein
MTYHPPHKPCADAATAGGGVSSGIGVGEFFGQPFDLHRYRVVFPDRWSAFLKAHFRDHIHAAFVFGVSERTARNWFEGVSAPRAEFALAACKHIPGAAAYLMEAA